MDFEWLKQYMLWGLVFFAISTIIVLIILLIVTTIRNCKNKKKFKTRKYDSK